MAAMALKKQIGQLTRPRPVPDFRPPAVIPAGPNSFVWPKFLAITTALLFAGYFLSRPLAPRFTSQSDPDRPQPANRVLQVDFGHQIRLVGMDELPQTIQMVAGDVTELTVTLYWRALQDLDSNYSIFLHLDAPNGQTLATVDEVSPENIPTRNWPPGLYLRNPLHLKIPDHIPPIRYDLNVGVYNRQNNQRLSIAAGGGTTFKLGSIWLAGTQPRLANEPLAYFGRDISLRRAVYSPPAGESLLLYWQSGQTIEQNYSIFVHLLDGEGNLLGQTDGVPYDGLYPPANWQPGQIVIDRRPLPPLENKAQLNALAIGIYDPTTGNRLAATDAHGNALPNNSFVFPVRP